MQKSVASREPRVWVSERFLKERWLVQVRCECRRRVMKWSRIRVQRSFHIYQGMSLGQIELPDDQICLVWAVLDAPFHTVCTWTETVVH